MKHLTNLSKLLFFVILFSPLMTTQALAIVEDEPNNDCNTTQDINISNGINIVTGTFENSSATPDYYQFTVPANGTITITWQNTDPAGNKVASMLVGTGCDDVNISNIYSGTDQSTTHVSPTITVERYEVYFIKIYNSNGKNYDLTIDYDVDVSGLTEDDYNRPDFCYDYSYSQGATPLNITEPPGLVDTVTVGTPIDINLLIRNLGTVTGYRLAENAVVDITDINVSQAAYEADGILVKEARVFEFEYIPNIELDTSPTYINEIDVGDIPTMDKFTIRYQLVPKVSDLNLSINATIAYELAVPIGDTYVMTSHTFNLGDIGPCESMQTGYSPAYSIFNVELDSLNGPTANGEDRTYNLPTQTANRADNFEVVSYKVDDVFTTNPVSTIVGVELIEVLYDDIYESCADEDRAISPRIWLDFTGTETGTDTTHIPFNAATIQEAIENGSISDQIYPSLDGTPPISLPGDFYSSARENVAFRVVYNALKDGEELIRLIKTDQGLRIDNFEALVQDISSCKQEVKNPQNNTITSLVSVACSNDGNNLTQTEVATCMECLYGYNTRYLCSRDNFAIRPESFRVSLSDQSQVSPVTQSHIKTNVDNSRINIAAGYQYKVDVNATNYLNDHNTPGYGQTFSETNATADKHFSFVWNANSSINPNNCNDTRDHNKSMKFINGLMENNLSNDQIGEYNLTILDRDWTRNDHEPELLAHHYIHPIHGDVDEYFVTGDNARDCVVDSSHVPLEGASAGIDGGTITNVSGCDIKSKHTRNNGTVTEYTDINTMIYPYDFNLTGVQPQIGPYTRSNTHAPFVYINTPPTLDIDNKDMSYNMNGRFFAAGYNDVLLTNFVDGCYADDVNMSLNFIYNSPEPATDQEPYLSYSLKDHHTYDETEIYRPVPVSGYVLDNHFEVGTDTNNSTPFKILQEEEFFVKEMNGSISMDLGYNFKRDYNKTLNPRYIEFKDFNITHAINSNTPTNIYADLTNDHKIFGDKILDHNVTFVYGRAKPSQYLYDDVTEDFVDTPISMVVYCDQDPVTCGAVYNITNGTFRQTDEYDWYLSRGHVTDQGDGDITLNASTGANVELSDASPFPINFIDGVNTPDVRVSANAGTTRPLDVDITFVAPPNTDKWLIYNRDKNEIPVPFYRVRFIDESGWAGHGDTGHVVESETSTKKNRRLGW